MVSGEGAEAYRINGSMSTTKTINFLASQLGEYAWWETDWLRDGTVVPSESLYQDFNRIGSQLTPQARTFLLDLVFDCNTDGCTCFCSFDGCSNVLIIMKELKRGCSVDADDRLPPTQKETIRLNRYLRRSKEFVKALVKEFKAFRSPRTDESLRRFELQLIRFLTFTRLGLRHTCHKRWHSARRRPSQDEIDEIWEEDRGRIWQLDVLMEEFKETRNSKEPISDFLDGSWEARMQQVLAEEQAVDEEYMRSVRGIGVRIEE